jgi:uncharacterized membrane protein
MRSNTTLTRKTLALLLAATVALSATTGLAGLAGAATTTNLTVSITDDDNTVFPGETTTVEIAVASADGGIGAAELGVELADSGVAAISDVTVLHEAGNEDNAVAGGGQSAEVKYAFANSPDTGSVTIVEVTLTAASPGSTDINIVENSQTGNLVVFDEVGAGYTLDSVGSATLTVEEPPEANFQVSNLQAPGSAEQGETIDVSADVENTGGQTATKSVEFRLDTNDDGSIADESAVVSQNVELTPGESTTVDFDVPTGELQPGTYTHGVATPDDSATAQIMINAPPEAANFQVSNLQAPGSATQGDTIDVSADVENTGDQSATKAVEFRLDANGDGLGDSGDVVLSQDVQLGAGASTTVGFTDVDTSALAPDTYTHGVVTPDDSETAQIMINPPPAGDKATTVSLQPTDQTGAVGTTTTYEVVVDSADGGVGAAEIGVSVDDTSVATIAGVEVVGPKTVEKEVTDSSAEFDYFGANTADSGSVVIAEVTVEGAGAGTASLSVGPTGDNSDVLVFDEAGQPYDVTGISGASLEVLPVQFLVDSTSAPEKAAVGSTATVTATVSSDGAVESTQSVELLFDVDGDGTMESVGTQQVTIGANGQTQVSFDVDVPADASFGDREYSVETISDSTDGTVEVTPPDVNGDGNLPNDPDDDGLFEDVNGDGNVNSGDAQALFGNRESGTVQNNGGAFDFNGDGGVNVGDAQALFNQLTG